MLAASCSRERVTPSDGARVIRCCYFRGFCLVRGRASRDYSMLVMISRNRARRDIAIDAMS